MFLSIEVLYHWSCAACQKWWSIADIAPDQNAWYTCPHCGARSKIDWIQNGNGDRVIGIAWKKRKEDDR